MQGCKRLESPSIALQEHRSKSCSFSFSLTNINMILLNQQANEAADQKAEREGKAYRPQCETDGVSRGWKNYTTCAMHVLNFPTQLIVNTDMKMLSHPLLNYR